MREPSFSGINVISDSHYKFSVRFPSYVVDYMEFLELHRQIIDNCDWCHISVDNDYMEFLQHDFSCSKSSFVSYCVEKWGATL